MSEHIDLCGVRIETLKKAIILTTQKFQWRIFNTNMADTKVVNTDYWISILDFDNSQILPDPLPHRIKEKNVLSKLLKAFATLEPETYLRLVVENEAERFESILADHIAKIRHMGETDAL